MQSVGTFSLIVLDLLCLQNGIEWMLEKLKNNHLLARDFIAYLKKRSAIEEEYGKNLAKLSNSMNFTCTDSSRFFIPVLVFVIICW